jgi:hypothetical protein
MSKTQTAVVASYAITAHDVDTGSPNRMHKDDLPKRLGYKGGFVLGTSNYGQMTRGLIGLMGESWLDKAIVDMKFLKPTFEGDLLQISVRPMPESAHERAYVVSAHNADDVEVIRVETWLPSPFPAPDPLSRLSGVEEDSVRERMTWDALALRKPFRPCSFTPTMEENRFWCTELSDDTALYREGANPPLHPTLVMRCFSKGNHAQFVSDKIIQVANRLVIHRKLRVGDPIEVVTIPLEKFEKRGNHWAQIYAAVRVDGIVAVEGWQTKIFNIGGSD